MKWKVQHEYDEYGKLMKYAVSDDDRFAVHWEPGNPDEHALFDGNGFVSEGGPVLPDPQALATAMDTMADGEWYDEQNG